jgi:hypothetical protein
MMGNRRELVGGVQFGSAQRYPERGPQVPAVGPPVHISQHLLKPEDLGRIAALEQARQVTHPVFGVGRWQAEPHQVCGVLALRLPDQAPEIVFLHETPSAS